MKLKTRSDNGLKNGKKLKETTKVFEGEKSLSLAQDYAFRTKSYVFEVIDEVVIENSRKRQEVFYGYGVPK